MFLFGVRRLSEPSTWILAAAVRELGPIGGWRCADGRPYVYDPRRERADSGLLAEAPEAVVRLAVPDVTVERVEADQQGGDTVVWSRAATDSESGQWRWDEGPGRRVYVLSPGRMQAVTWDSAQHADPTQPGDSTQRASTICQSHLGDWRIVAEHALG